MGGGGDREKGECSGNDGESRATPRPFGTHVDTGLHLHKSCGLAGSFCLFF